MSREIKFRAWDTVQEVMLPVQGIDFRNNVITLDEGDNSVSDSSEMFILMQYTGLTDCYGKEIYEGDIVKFTYNSSPQTEHIGKVEWNEKDLAWQFAGYLIEPTPRKTMEVIGNKFEHPHLLKE